MNTVSKKGCISLLEEHFGYPVDWDICMLPHLDLPFFKLFELYNGTPKGPDGRGFVGELGETIGSNDLHLKEAADFKIIPVNIEMDEIASSSTNKD